MRNGLAVAAAVIVAVSALKLATTRRAEAPGRDTASDTAVSDLAPAGGTAATTPPFSTTENSVPSMTNTPSASPDRSFGADPAASAAVQAAKQALALELGVDVAAIQVVSAEAVTWPDGSLGCPQPGQMYIQVLTDGFRVVLEAGGRQATYHSGRGNPPAIVRCDNPGPGGIGFSDR